MNTSIAYGFSLNSNHFEFIFTAKEKMNIPNNEPIRLVLECDGTQVEDGEYFRTLPYNTVIMVLRNDQKWYPLNIEALRTGTYYVLFVH